MEHEHYVQYEIAKNLHCNGFGWTCDHFYVKGSDIIHPFQYYHDFCKKETYQAPTLDIACDWLLETHKIHLQIEVYWCEDGMKWLCKVLRIEQYNTTLLKTVLPCDTKQAAVSTGILWYLMQLGRK